MFRSKQKPPPTEDESHRPKQAGWRGWGKRASEAARIYRWQQVDWTQQQLHSLQRRLLAYRLKLTALWALVVALMAAFVWFLVYSPAKTLFVTVAVTRYRAPFPPNSWAREDVQSFQPFGGQTLDLLDLSSEWRTREMGVRALENRLRDSASQIGVRTSAVLYFSMHGVVDENGEPCLLLPDSSPTQASTWLPVRELLRLIKRERSLSKVHKLVILDCSRMDSNWSMGMTYNAFVDRLPEVVRSEADSRLCVLNSTSSEQIGWTAPELRGSVFGHFLRQALEGEADQWLQNGDGDRRLSLKELTAYLQHHVDEWVREHRNDRQLPQLFPAEAQDFEVAWTYAGSGFSISSLGSWWFGGSNYPENVTPEVAKASLATKYVTPPYLTTPGIAPPSIATDGAFGLSVNRPTFTAPYVSRPQLAIPPVQGPGLASSTVSFDSLNIPSKEAKGDDKPEAKAEGAAPAGGAAKEGAGDKAEATTTYTPFALWAGQPVDEDQLDQLWLKHDVLAAARVYSRDPLGWRKLQQSLLRVEQFAAAGPAYRLPTQALIADVETQIEQLAQPVVDKTMPAHSLPMALRFGRITESAASIRALADSLGSAGLGAQARFAPEAFPHGVPAAAPRPFVGPLPLGATPAGSLVVGGGPGEAVAATLVGADAAAPAGDAKADASKLLEGPFSYSARAQAAWLHLLDGGDARASGVRKDLNFIGLPDPDLEPGMVEIHFLRLLDRFVDADPARRPPSKYIRMAAGARAMGEQASLPIDLRAFYAAYEPCQRGDEARRRGEDRLFVGSKASLDEAEAYWKQAETEYIAAASQAQSITVGYSVRDDVLCELPYLAVWYTRRLPQRDLDRGRRMDEGIRQQLLPLIDDVHKLSKSLDDSIAVGAAAIKGLDQPIKESLTLLQQLRLEFRRECDELASKEPDNENTYRRIQDVMALPLVPAAQRRELRDRGARIALHLLLNNTNTDAARDAETGKPVEEISHLDRMTLVWPQHPLVALLNSDDMAAAGMSPAKGSDFRSDLARSEQLSQTFAWGAAIRQQFDRLSTELANLETGPVEKTSNAQRTGLERRLRAGGAERLLRASAVVFPGVLDVDPVELCRRLDLHNLFVWSANRTMDDFYGSGDPEIEPFFFRVASRYLEAAESISSQQGKSLYAEDERSWQRLKDLKGQSGKVVKASTDDLLLSGTETTVARELKVQVSQRAPEGVSAVWLREARGPTLPIIDSSVQPVLRMAVAVTPSDNPQVRDPRTAAVPFFYDVPVLNQSEARLEAAAFYRGHFLASPYFLERSSGAEIRFVPPPSRPARINVFGQTRRRGSVVFILDSSQSMNALTRTESPDSSARKLPRLDVATTTLRTMLGRLAQQGNFYVGLRLYGHRAGRNLAKPDEILFQQEYSRPIPDGLLPSEDVENVLTLGRFTSNQYVEVDKILSSIKPWGETPLYLSIQQALRDFDSDDPNVAKSVVAITDGLNYQFNSPKQVSREALLASIRERKIPVYIVGFGIDPGERGVAEKEFRSIASASGGRYYEASDGTGLAEALNHLLRPGEYTIQDQQTQQTFGPRLLGEPIDVPVAVGARRSVEIQMRTGSVEAVQSLQLAGGEALELNLSEDGRRLDFQRDMRGNPTFSKPVPEDAAEPVRYVVGAHRPEWTANQLTFPISFQNARANGFSKPPEDVWVEILPDLSTGKETPFVFYDLCLQPGRGAPVQQCRTLDWPGDARSAKIRVWWKDAVTPPDMEVPLNDFATPTGGRMVQEGDARPVPSAPEASIRVQILPAEGNSPLRLVVMESYSVKAVDLNALRVTTSIMPQSASRRYDRANRIAIHTFFFPNLTLAELRSQCRVLVTAARSIKNGAFALPTALEIPVPPSPDVITPN